MLQSPALSFVDVTEPLNSSPFRDSCKVTFAGSIYGTLFLAHGTDAVRRISVHGTTVASEPPDPMHILLVDLSQMLPGVHHAWTFSLKHPTAHDFSLVNPTHFVAVIRAIPAQVQHLRFPRLNGDVMVFKIHAHALHLVPVPPAFMPIVETVLSDHGSWFAGGYNLRSSVQSDGVDILLIEYLP